MANPDMWDGSRMKQPKSEARTPRKPIPRGKRPKAETPEHKELVKRWKFIKACMMLAQRRTDGFYTCMECGRQDPPRIDLDHIIPAGNGGKWTPDNAQLLCAGFEGSCHSRKHGEPMWSRKESA